MKALVSFWWNRNPFRIKKFFFSLLVLLGIVSFNYFLNWFNPETWREVFFLSATGLGVMGALQGVVTFAVALIFISSGFGECCTFIRAIRFRNVFGFWPPSTAEGSNALQRKVDSVLKELAEGLDAQYKVEEATLAGIRNSDIPEYVLKLEKKLRYEKKWVQKRKKDFYSHRNIARAIGFQIDASYKHYLL